MNWPGPERWLRLWQATGSAGDPSAWYELLTWAYAEPHRHYHNQQHIADCLAEFDSARQLAKQPGAVELALWFHDAVYDPRAADNEERSAALAKRCLESAGQAGLVTTVVSLIMATKLHDKNDNEPDVGLMLDVDLSILGQNENRFAEYERGIRSEYAWVPQETFNAKRSEILQRFLNRERIYASDRFFTNYERNAQQNLERSIRALTS
jgi:predicted metal-dependent HD superfamily phosphohydrolase